MQFVWIFLNPVLGSRACLPLASGYLIRPFFFFFKFLFRTSSLQLLGGFHKKLIFFLLYCSEIRPSLSPLLFPPRSLTAFSRRDACLWCLRLYLSRSRVISCACRFWILQPGKVENSRSIRKTHGNCMHNIVLVWFWLTLEKAFLVQLVDREAPFFFFL